MTFTEQRDNVRQQLTDSQNRLQELQKELPTFEKLVTENEALETEIRKRKASLDELSAQKLRTISARELLEQHEGDIETLETEVAEQTEELDRLEQLAALKALEIELSALQQEYRKGLSKIIEGMVKDFKALAQKRDKWNKVLGQVPSLFSSLTGASWDIYDVGNSDRVQKERRDRQKGFDILKENGINTSALWSEKSITLPIHPEVRGLTRIVLGHFYQDGQPTITLPEAIKVAGLIPEHIMDSKQG
jgi:chromosome segregation ATPase